MKNSDPVIVTADEAITKMTPVTAVTPMQRPYPASAPAPSRYQLPGEPTEVLAPRPKTRSSEPHTLWHRHTTAPYGNNQLRQELNRLEQNATGASTADERLAYELQAIELKISMKTGKRPDPVEQPDISRMEAPCNINLIPTSVSTHRQQTTTLHRALEAQVERGDELIYKQHQEEQDRQLAQKLMMEELQSNRQTHK
ncbi:hypothetical protein SNE40_001117 [Patella caerulea]|uniref:Uncharacterized protein n=1 Tax=Patella caerulea TaxID=87958 RepID=A0AAN8KIN9_PATCE